MERTEKDLELRITATKMALEGGDLPPITDDYLQAVEKSHSLKDHGIYMALCILLRAGEDRYTGNYAEKIAELERRYEAEMEYQRANYKPISTAFLFQEEKK